MNVEMEGLLLRSIGKHRGLGFSLSSSRLKADETAARGEANTAADVGSGTPCSAFSSYSRSHFLSLSHSYNLSFALIISLFVSPLSSPLLLSAAVHCSSAGGL